MKNPYNIIKIDKNTNKISSPDLLLMNRSFDIIGKIPNYTNWNISLVGNGLDEISFEVHKYNNGVLCPVWDDLMDLKIVDVRNFGRFEISVDYTDNTETVKSVHGVSLETELGQIPLYEFHVNDEDAADMEITEYSADNYDNEGNFIPTVFYNKNDHKHSLLHRVLADKAPHWSIGTTPNYIILEDKEPEPVETFQRTYTCDGDTIYDFLTGTVAEESNVVFVFDTINRTINCYNLCEYVDESGKVISNCVGKDTNVFISKRKLANEITISSNKDTVKNCFRVEGGDDIITDCVRVVNMNGSNYIYQFADFQLDDMPDELIQKIKSYNEKIEAHREEYYGTQGIEDFVSGMTGVQVSSFEDFTLIQMIIKGSKIKTDVISSYTELISTYSENNYWYVTNDTLNITDSYGIVSSKCTSVITVTELFKNLGVYTRLCEKYDEQLYYESEMMPAVTITDPTDAKTQYENIVNELSSMSVGVSSLSNYNDNLFVGITNNVEAMAQILVDSRFKVEVIEETTSYASKGDNHIWTGNIKVTRLADATDYYPKTFEDINKRFDVCIDDDELIFTKQKLQKALAKGSMSDIDFNVEEMWGTEKIYVSNILTLNHSSYSNCIKCDNYFRISSLSNLSNGYIICKTYDWQGNLINTIDKIKTPVTIDTNNVSYVKLFYAYDQGSARITYVAQQPDLQKVKDYFNLYSLNRLKSFYDGYNSCLSILATMGKTTTSATLNELYYNYYWRMAVVEDVYNKRQEEVDKINAEIVDLETEQKNLQDSLNFQKHLETNTSSDDLYEIFCSYRREDTYKNDNYISDGLSSSECLEKAKELVDVANVEIKKSCVLQRTVSTSLNNLLLLPEFESLYDTFALFNYIRIRTEDEILKLRLIGIDFSGESVENINVTFAEQIESVDGKLSDLQSVIQQASSIASSYSSTTLQAKQGANANNLVSEMYNSGLNAAKTMLANNDNNEITITSAGINCRRMDDEGYYGEKQLRITGNIMAFTDDDWQSVKMAIGETLFTNPITGEDKYEYGIVAENIVGKMIIGDNAFIGNSNGTVQITGNGIKINDSDNTSVFSVTNDGDAYFKGTIEADSGYFKGKIAGGYLYIHNDNEGYSVTIDPMGYLKQEKDAFDIFNIKGTADTIMNVDSNGTGTFKGYIEARQLDAIYPKNGQKYGQYDAGEFQNRKGIGIITENYDKAYIGFGYKSSDGSPTLSELIEIDNDSSKHRFNCDVNFNSYVHLGSTYLSGTNGGIYCSGSGHFENNVYANGTMLSKDGHNMNTHTYTWTSYGNLRTGAEYNLASVNWVRENYTRQSSSDYRLKKEITSINNIIDIYMGFKPKQYKYKDTSIEQNEKYYFGLLAQEVQNNFKNNGLNINEYNIVEEYNTRPYMNEGQYVSNCKALRINYVNLHAYHIAFNQEVYRKLTNLTTEVTNLKKHIKKLEKTIN